MHLDIAPSSGHDRRVADTTKWMTIKDACACLNISRQALYDAVKASAIERTELLGKPVVRKSDVLKYVPRAYPRKGGTGADAKPPETVKTSLNHGGTQEKPDV